VNRAVLALVLAGLAGCQADAPPEAPDAPVAGQPSAAEQVNDIADRYYAWTLERLPEQSYFAAVELPAHDGLFDNSPAAKVAADAAEDAFLAELQSVDTAALVGQPEWITMALLEQELASSVAKRVCRQALWNVNQMGGWHSAYAQIAMLQPVDTPELREQALARWSKLPAFIDQEIANLEAGIERGFSAPKTVTRRVVDQVDGLVALPLERSPFYSMAARADDEAFGAALAELVENRINPALVRYRDYLRETYMAAAREDLSVTANPGGAECYEASLRGYTTLDRSGRDTYELGQATVAANTAGVIELGKAAYGLEDFGDILAAAKADPDDKFASREELLAVSKAMVERAEAEMPNWVGRMPAQSVEVVPFMEHEEGTGRSAHYNPGNASRPAEYRIPLSEYAEQSRGSAEIVAFHETWPGHHLQVATFQSIEGLHPVTQLIWFSGPGEGWARYSEALAEEMGLYETTSGPILRRSWPARGMVVDPGIHLFGWTRQEARAYMLAAGRPEGQVDDMVDRIAILPGQLTAYDSGGLEIFALRRQAEEALGDAFDVREFHDVVLENGTVPLGYLRQHVEAWIASKQ
jgi:uncharacterized protein (DUF885 family)